VAFGWLAGENNPSRKGRFQLTERLRLKIAWPSSCLPVKSPRSPEPAVRSGHPGGQPTGSAPLTPVFLAATVAVYNLHPWAGYKNLATSIFRGFARAPQFRWQPSSTRS